MSVDLHLLSCSIAPSILPWFPLGQGAITPSVEDQKSPAPYEALLEARRTLLREHPAAQFVPEEWAERLTYYIPKYKGGVRGRFVVLEREHDCIKKTVVPLGISNRRRPADNGWI